MASEERDFLRRIQDSRQADIARLSSGMVRSPEEDSSAIQNAYRALRRFLEPESATEVAGLVGASLIPGVGEAVDVADISIGLSDLLSKPGGAKGDVQRILFGLGGLALPFVTGSQIRVGSKTLSGRAAEIFKDLLRKSPGSSREELADVAQRRATVEAERAASAARRPPQREGIASLDPQYSDPDVPEVQPAQIDLFDDIEDIPTSVQDASFRNIPIEDPATRQALTLARRGEGTPEALTLVSEARPVSGETLETLAESAIRQTSRPDSGDAFDFAAQSIWGQGPESAMAMAESLRKGFPGLSEEEFAYRFSRAIERLSETKRVLDEIPTSQRLREKSFVESISGSGVGGAQGVIRDNPVMNRGKLTGYPSPGDRALPGLPGILSASRRPIFDKETGELTQATLSRGELLRQQTPMDRAADKIIQRRAGNIDIDELPVMRAGDPDEDMLPVERLFDPEEAYDLSTERERLSELFGEDIPTSLDFNSIKEEMRMMDEFSDASDEDIIDAIRNALSTSSRPVAGRVGRATLEASRGADGTINSAPARHLMRGVDVGAASARAGRRRGLLESGREVMQEADVLKLVEKYLAGEELSPKEFQIALSHIMSKTPNRNARPRSFPLSSVQGSRGRRQRGSR